MFEQRFCVFDSQALNEAFRSGPRPPLEEPLEVKRAQLRARRDIAQQRLVSIVCFDEVDAGLDALVVSCVHGSESMWMTHPCHTILAARETAMAKLDAQKRAVTLPDPKDAAPSRGFFDLAEPVDTLFFKSRCQR